MPRRQKPRKTEPLLSEPAPKQDGRAIFLALTAFEGQIEGEQPEGDGRPEDLTVAFDWVCAEQGEDTATAEFRKEAGRRGFEGTEWLE